MFFAISVCSGIIFAGMFAISLFAFVEDGAAVVTDSYRREMRVRYFFVMLAFLVTCVASSYHIDPEDLKKDCCCSGCTDE